MINIMIDNSLKARTFIYRRLRGRPEQQRFTVRSGVLTGTSSRQRSAIRGRPLPERTDFGPALCGK